MTPPRVTTPEDVLKEAELEVRHADRLLSVARAAKRLQLHPETIRRWIRSGKLSALRYPNGQFKIAEALIEKIRTTPCNI